MKKKTQIIILIAFFLILILLLGILTFFSSYIPSNPKGTIGNTAGNLNNSGLFCEHDGKVYFSNTFEGGSLFSMNADESKLERLNGLEVQNILAGGKYLYYFQTGASNANSGFGQLDGIKTFDRCTLKGTGITALTNDVVTTAQLVDNSLYLMTTSNSGLSFYKMNTAGEDITKLSNYLINPACAKDGNIYYNGTQSNHYLYSLNTATDVVGEVWRGNVWFPIVENDYVYYLDPENDYKLCRYSLSLDMVEILTKARVDCFNVGNGYIYYQTNSLIPQLICMHDDGSNVTVLAEGIYTDINMTSRYVYFRKFGDDSTLYHSALGSDRYEIFEAAQKATSSD